MFSHHVRRHVSKINLFRAVLTSLVVGGQGIASGFRDAAALSWRLAIACRSSTLNPAQALVAWYTERKQQLETSLASTVRNGDRVNTKSPVKIFVRDWGLWLLQLIPPIKRWIELGPRQASRMRYQHVGYMPFMPEFKGGALFSQTYCVALDCATNSPAVRFTDDVIFAEEKKALFQIVILLDNDLSRLQCMKASIEGLEGICPWLCPAESSAFVRRPSIPGEPAFKFDTLKGVYRTATAGEFERSPLCGGRPAPRGYREFDMWAGVDNKKFIILRSDRFVFAACDTRRELELAAQKLNELFPK